jgi:alkylation response protein AidB-like acyl-CoA dehydrogenase
VDGLSALAEAADGRLDWPIESLRFAEQAGAWRWSIDAAHGGDDWDAASLMEGYERLATGCLTAAFIVSQREAAVRRLRASPNRELQDRVLPLLARGELFTTVGLSQLTTSRQHQQPALVATPIEGGGYRLNGIVPWVTGADRADFVVVGAPVSEHRQILLALPTDARGVRIEPPLHLTALLGSRTALIHCDDVEVSGESIVAGPVERVLHGGGGGTGGLETSCLALGLAGAAIDYLSQEAVLRPDLVEAGNRFQQKRVSLRARLRQLAQHDGGPTASVKLRVDCNRLVLQATQAALLAAKGAGFVSTHPAQRWARQALFFLVWSCPRPAAEGMLAELLPS